MQIALSDMRVKLTHAHMFSFNMQISAQRFLPDFLNTRVYIHIYSTLHTMQGGVQISVNAHTHTLTQSGQQLKAVVAYVSAPG